jgi:hypothetical protein
LQIEASTGVVARGETLVAPAYNSLEARRHGGDDDGDKDGDDDLDTRQIEIFSNSYYSNMEFGHQAM